jgi:hypothetical protein
VDLAPHPTARGGAGTIGAAVREVEGQAGLMQMFWVVSNIREFFYAGFPANAFALHAIHF